MCELLAQVFIHPQRHKPVFILQQFLNCACSDMNWFLWDDVIATGVSISKRQVLIKANLEIIVLKTFH